MMIILDILKLHSTKMYESLCCVITIFKKVTTVISVLNMREKGRDLTQSYDKAPTPTENPKSNLITQKRHQNFDYTTIADRLRTVSWGNHSHTTGVVKPVNGIPTLPLTTTVL